MQRVSHPDLYYLWWLGVSPPYIFSLWWPILIFILLDFQECPILTFVLHDDQECPILTFILHDDQECPRPSTWYLHSSSTLVPPNASFHYPHPSSDLGHHTPHSCKCQQLHSFTSSSTYIHTTSQDCSIVVRTWWVEDMGDNFFRKSLKFQ